MGARASNLRSRQQVQDSSTVNNQNAAVVVGDNDKSSRYDSNKNGDVSSNNNNNNSYDVEDLMDDVMKIKQAIHDEVVANSSGSNKNQQQCNDGRPDTQLNGNTNTSNNDLTATSADINGTKPASSSTLQRQASHLKSLAQRIKRSSSLRAPKLRAFLPAFANGRRKVSMSNSVSTRCIFALRI